MNKQLFQKKDIPTLLREAKDGESKMVGLKRSLSLTNLIALGIGAIVGTGIFVITGTAAAQYAGPGLAISFVISAISCVMSGLCYAEFASIVPVAGSVYSYSYTTLGEIFAWFVGWILVFEYLFACSSVAVGWSGYLNSLLAQLHISLPQSISGSTFLYNDISGWSWSGSIINFPAVFIIVVLSVLLARGIKQSAWVNDVIVVIKVVIILLFIGFGLSHIDTANWHPFIPKNTGDFGHFGWSGIFRGAGIVFYAYIGFDALSTAAQETKNPQKDMPRGILLTLLICAILYVVVTLVLTGIVNYKELDVPAPIALAIDKAGPALAWLSPLIKIGAILGLSSVILVMLLGQSRIYYAISKDGLVPPFFSKVHKKSRVPMNSIVVGCILTAIAAGLFPLDVLSQLVSIGTLIAFTMVCISVIVLRYKQPNLHRPFKTPWVPFVPIVGAGICIFQMVSMSGMTWVRLVIWLIIGSIIYFTYGKKHSTLAASTSLKTK